MSRDDDQPATERAGPRWNAKTAPLEPRRNRISDAPATEPTVRESPAPPSAPSRFAIRDELGRGGMGSVYAAHDSVLGREVAIKQALADDAGALRLFEREAKITAQLEHPSIVPVHDAGRDEDGRPYYIMRRLEGEPLADRVTRAPDVKARLALVPHVLAAVDAAAFAHARGVIHRDIKPWNILLGDYGETVLIDWGLARRLDDKEADEVFAAQAVGTPGYMAPEQVRGEVIDTRADVYALGATLLHVLIGKPAVDTTPTEWMAEAALGPAPPIDKLDPEVPVELTAIVTKAMAPNASDRYRDAVEMAADLRAFLAGKLVAAHRYTPVQRIARFVRLHRVAVATAAAALIAISVTAVLAIQNVVVERDRAREAQAQAADRAELMLVERASTLASHDPTRAVALLRTLPLTSRYARRARDIATKASANGITHGRKVHTGAVRALAFAPDGRRVASTGDDGSLQIHDTAANTSRILVELKVPLGLLVWADRGATIVFASDDDVLYAVDVASGAMRVIDAHTETSQLMLAGKGDRVRVHDQARRRISEYSTNPSVPPIVIAEDAGLVDLDGDRAFVAGWDTLRFYDATGEHLLLRDPAVGRLASLELSESGALAVTATMTEIVQWDLRELKVTQRFAHSTSYTFFDGARLYANNRARAGALDLLGSNISEAVHGDWSLLWRTEAGTGVAILNQAGDIAFSNGYALYVFPDSLPPARAIAGLRGSPIVAVGSRNGWIRWLDLRMLMPKTFDVPSSAQLCGTDGEHVYVTSMVTHELMALPRRNAPVRTMTIHALDCLIDDGGSRVALFTAPGQWTIVDAITNKAQRITTNQLAAWKDSFFYIVRQRDVAELTKTDERTIWTAPADIRTLAVNDDWLAIDLADGRLLRVNRHTKQATFVGVTPGVTRMILEHDGTIWCAIGSRLYRGTHTIALFGTLPSDVDSFGVLQDGSVLATSGKVIWRIGGYPGAMQLTTLSEHMRATGGTRSVVAVDGFATATQKYLDTGEEVTRYSRGAIGAMVDDSCIVLYVGQSKSHIELYEDPVPQDPNQLHAWIDTATNAVLEPGSDDLTWR
jgi:predicted Ser/Thr protein kinase